MYITDLHIALDMTGRKLIFLVPGIVSVIGGLFLLGLDALAWSSYLACAAVTSCSVAGMSPSEFLWLLLLGIVLAVVGIVEIGFVLRRPTLSKSAVCPACGQTYPRGPFRYCTNCGRRPM
jgi:hypothetical protein